MDSVPGRAKHLETIISSLLLAILFLIGVGIFIKQFDMDLGRFGMDASTTGLQSARLENNRKEMALSSFLPPGFETLSDIEVYDSESLYEKINGKAPLYTESGFEKLFTQRFVSKDDRSLWMELFVYDMGGARNAFSVYSTQRRAGADILSLFHPSFGYRTANALFFCHGRYYVELIGSTESKELFNAMIKTIGEVRTDLTCGDDTAITEFVVFPEDNFVPGSIKLYLTNTFGFEGLTNTFTAQYQIDGETITAFLSKRTDPEDAEAVAENYRKFLVENGGVVKKAASEVFEDRIINFYETTEIVFAAGVFVAGAHEAENQHSAEKLAAMLIKKLKSADNE